MADPIGVGQRAQNEEPKKRDETDGTDGAKKDGQIDLRGKPKKDERVGLKEVSPYSETWAEVVRPLTRILFTLLAAVLLIPFLFAFVGDPATQTVAFDWAKTILAPTVGFASAAIGYYYGTRATGVKDDKEKDNGDEQPMA